MDEAALAAIKTRAEAATNGPWTWVESAESGWTDHGPWLYAGAGGNEATQIIGAWGHDAWGVVLGDDLGQGINCPDAVFIAHAREDVPALVAEVERLRQALAEYGGHNEGCSGQYGPSYRCRCGWRDEARALGIGVAEEGAG